jgi:hypothetical protein
MIGGSMCEGGSRLLSVWRITFRIDKQEIEIIDLNFEDYH